MVKTRKMRNRYQPQSEDSRLFPTIVTSLMLAFYYGIVSFSNHGMGEFSKSSSEILLAKNLEVGPKVELIETNYTSICDAFNYSDICQNK